MAVFILISASDINLNGYYVKQYDASFTFNLPDTTVSEGCVIVIGRNADKAAFEAFWSVTFGSNVLYINSSDALPKINGDETFSLHDSTDLMIDSTSMGEPPDGLVCIKRDSTNVNTWQSVPASMADPGVYTGGGHNCGLRITEFSDTSGTGNYIYEYVELYNDPNLTGINESKEVHASLHKYDFMTATLNFSETVHDIAIYNVIGNVVVNADTANRIILDDLASGLYFIRYFSGDCAYSGKITVIR